MLRRFTKFLWIEALTIAMVTLAAPLPGRTAERITGYFAPFKDFSVSVRDLEAFAQEGKIPAEYADLAKQTPPAQLQQLRQSLQQRFNFSPEYVSQFTSAPLVEKLLERVGESIQTDRRQNGMKSLRLALIRAAGDKKQGLTAINVLRRFPSRQINLNLAEVFTSYNELTELFKRRDSTILAFNRIATAEAATSTTDFSSRLDLRRGGHSAGKNVNLHGWIERANGWCQGISIYPKQLPVQYQSSLSLTVSPKIALLMLI